MTEEQEYAEEANWEQEIEESNVNEFNKHSRSTRFKN